MLVFDASFVAGKINKAARAAIQRAVLRLGLVHPCTFGHAWKSEGGRCCPHRPADDPGECSQTVYRCTRCPAYDYGEPGGPAWRDCFAEGPCHPCCLDFSTAEDGAGITAPRMAMLEHRQL